MTGRWKDWLVCEDCSTSIERSHVSEDPLTIDPSILCPDCGTHGFVRAGRWQGV